MIGNVLNFIKGKKAISKYYKGLDSAAKNYISAAKKIDKMDRDKRAGYRKSELDKYENSIKGLDEVKKKIDELKADSKILQKYDSFANNKYKIKMFMTGRKANISLSKMKGYEDDIDKIKAEQTSLEDDIKKAEKEAADKKAEVEAAEKKAKEESGENTTSDKSKDEPKDEKSGVKKALEKMKENLKGLMKEKSNAIKKDLGQDKIDEISNKMKSLKDKIADKEIELKENSSLSLRFFYELEVINEEIKCLENLIEESL